MTMISENAVLTNISPILIMTNNYYTNGLARSVIIKMKNKGDSLGTETCRSGKVKR